MHSFSEKYHIAHILVPCDRNQCFVRGFTIMATEYPISILWSGYKGRKLRLRETYAQRYKNTYNTRSTRLLHALALQKSIGSSTVSRRFHWNRAKFELSVYFPLLRNVLFYFPFSSASRGPNDLDFNRLKRDIQPSQELVTQAISRKWRWLTCCRLQKKSEKFFLSVTTYYSLWFNSHSTLLACHSFSCGRVNYYRPEVVLHKVARTT
jgi:hypothetical protein